MSNRLDMTVDLPEEWTVVQLGDLLDQSRVAQPRSSEADSVPFIPMNLLSEAALDVLGFEVRTPAEVRSGVFVKNGDLLLAKITPCLENGKQGIVRSLPGGCGFATTEVFPLRTRAALDTEFLAFYLRQGDVRRELADKMEGTTGRQRLPRVVVDRLPITLPPLHEQQAIVRVLRIVHSVRESSDTVIAATRALKQSLMHHLFTYGPVPVGEADKVPLKETAIGPVPEHWSIRQLGELAKVGNGSTPKRTNPSYWNPATVPWLTSGKVHERVIQVADEYVSPQARVECHLPLVPRGSVVVAITGQGKTLGHAALLDLDSCINQHLAFIQPQIDRLEAKFLLAFLEGHYDDLRAAGFGGGSTKGALTCAFLKDYAVPVPSANEQRLIAEALGAVDAKLAAESDRAAALDGLFKSLLENLMTGRLRAPEAEAAVAAAGVG